MAEQKAYDGFNNRWKFTGKELDEETGLYYFGARFYNPVTSLWLSVDPLVEETMDAYGYCFNNPIKLVDPDGRSPMVPPTKGSKEWDNFIKVHGNNENTKGGNNVNWLDKDGSWTYNAKTETWVGFGTSKGNNISAVNSIQEANVGFSLNLKWGGLSLSFGPEFAVGNDTNDNLNTAGRFNGNFSFDLRKTLSLKEWEKSSTDIKLTLGGKISNKGTLKSGFNTKTSTFTKFEATLLGSGGEFKISEPTSKEDNVTSFSGSIKIGVKIGAKPSVRLNQTIGTETKSTGTALGTDKSCY